MRTHEQSCAYLDEIVGRCVRDEEFAQAVLSGPEAALAGYALTDDEMDDFRALSNRHREEARQAWASLRIALTRSMPARA